jgi:hypothetical protein
VTTSPPQGPALPVAVGLALALVSAWGPPSRASSWSACSFVVIVGERTTSHVQIKPERFLGSDGSGQLDEPTCRRLIGSTTIALSSVSTGAELLTPGARLQGHWSQYSAMTPTGPMSASGWRFLQP